MRPLLRLAIRDLMFQRKFLIFFVFNLYLGLVGLTAVETFRGAIQTSLNSRAKNILGSDLAVGARRPLTIEEAILLDQLAKPYVAKSEVFEVYTMASGPQGTRLVEVRAIEKGMPYYGEIRTGSERLIQELDSFYTEPEVLVFPELLLQLNLKVGDRLKIGDLDFLIRDTIENDTSSAGSGFEFAPPIYTNLDQFKKSGLLKPGATGYFSHNFKFDSAVDIEALAQNLHTKMTDPAIQVTTPKNASEQVGRALGYLTDYLGLTSLVGLLLTSICQYFLFRRQLLLKQKDIAIFKSLGSSPKQIFTLFIIQTLLMSLVALALAIVSTALILPILQPLIYKVLQTDLQFQIQGRTLIIAGLSSFFGGILCIISPLTKALKTNVTALMSSRDEADAPLKLKSQFISDSTPHFLTFVVFTTLAMIISNSIRTGFVFALLVLATVATISLFGSSVLAALKFVVPKKLSFRIALRQILFHKQANLLMFSILTLSTALISLIPQLSTGLQQELSTPKGLQTPSLFLFDIQDEQRDNLIQFLSTQNLTPLQTSPMIRARLVSINDEPFEKQNRRGEGLTREEENENRFRNRGFNLSYRNHLSESEKIVKGTPFQSTSTGLPQISIEERFSKRLNINLNDKLKFEIQGVEVEGQVVNLRHVRWTSFQPNFFIQFEDGPLNEAPKTHIITLPKIDMTLKNQLQRDLLDQFPNVSIVDVARVVEKLSGIIKQMSYAIVAMAIFTALIGLVIVFSILNLQVQVRGRDFVLLKQIGASHTFIHRLFLSETMMLSLLALCSGLILARLLNLFVTHFVFDGISAYSPQADLIIAGLFLFGTTAITFLISKSLNRSVREALQ